MEARPRHLVEPLADRGPDFIFMIGSNLRPSRSVDEKLVPGRVAASSSRQMAA